MTAAAPSTKNPRAVAGWAQAEELLSRVLTDKEALPLLDNALKVVKAAFADPNAPEAAGKAPGVMDPLFIAEAVLRISRSRRVTSPQERIDELDLAQGVLESVPEIRRTEQAWMMLSSCLTERAIAQPTTRPHSLDEAKGHAESVYKKNPNAAHALRQLGVISIRRAENLLWKEAETKLSEAQILLDQSRLLDPDDYLATCLSADVLLQLAERRTREEARELVRLAKERYLAASKLDGAWPDAFLGLGWADLLLARRNSAPSSISFADAVMKLGGEALTRRPDSSRAFRLLGNSRRQAGRAAPRDEAESLFQEAFRHYEEGNKSRPDDYALLTDWAFCFLAHGARRQGSDASQSLASALEKADAALALAPHHPYAHLARGDVFLRRSSLEQDQQAGSLLDSATQCYDAALRIAMDLEGGLIGQALVATRRSERAPKESRAEGLPQAAELLQRALNLRSDNEWALEALGEVLWRQALDRQDYAASLETAREYYDRARTIDGQLEHSHLRVAEIDVALAKISRDPRRMDGAVRAFRAAADQFSDLARAHLGLGRALEQAVSSKSQPMILTAFSEEECGHSVAEVFARCRKCRDLQELAHRGRRTCGGSARQEVGVSHGSRAAG